MNTKEIVDKLWKLCDVLRDDGITYHQYVTELTYILFLKMAKETNAEKNIPEGYRWDDLIQKNGIALHKFYKELLEYLGEKGKGIIKEIYALAKTSIDEPNNLAKIVDTIDKLDWYSAKYEGLGNLYEGLLEKNASEKKSGAGQYFTPRPLINVMTRLIEPKRGERCGDPACGTFGFMIAADRFIKDRTDELHNLNDKQIEFQKKEAFSGFELVRDTHRLALMNAMLHDISGKIILGDCLSNQGKGFENYDVILTNPPFGTKKGGERPTRDDLTFPTSNKQLNFLQVIYRALKPNGRAAVVLPDNVLFQDGDGQKIRADLMDKCNLHTILRLPTGIFYAQGVKTNVLFFNKGTADKDNTKKVWFYDLRTNMESFGKTNTLNEEHFKEFELSFHKSEKEKSKLNRWSIFSLDEIRQKNYSLDLGLIQDDSVINQDDLPDPIESANDVIEKLTKAQKLLKDVVKELNVCY